MHKALLQRTGREEEGGTKPYPGRTSHSYCAFRFLVALTSVDNSVSICLPNTESHSPTCPCLSQWDAHTWQKSKGSFFPFSAEIYLICFEQEKTQIPGPLNKGELWRGNTINVLILCHPFFETLGYIKLILQMKAKS